MLLTPTERFACGVQGGARNGSTWGLCAPVTPVLALLQPLLTFASPQQGDKGSALCTWAVYGQLCPQAGGEQRHACLLNIAGRVVSGCPRGSVTQQFTLALFLPIFPDSGERGGCGETAGMGLGSGRCLGQDLALCRWLLLSVGTLQRPGSFCPSHVLGLTTTFGKRNPVFQSILFGQGRGVRWGGWTRVPTPLSDASLRRGCRNRRVPLPPRRNAVKHCEKRDIPASH